MVVALAALNNSSSIRRSFLVSPLSLSSSLGSLAVRVINVSLYLDASEVFATATSTDVVYYLPSSD